MPSTRPPSAPLPAGMIAERIPRARAPSSCGSTPRIARSVPSSASSPSTTVSASTPSGSCPTAPSVASASARSSAAPLLRKSAGARLTVMAYSSISTPSRASALATRTRASRTAASASPTIWKNDGPRVQHTSTRMRCASSPTSVLASAQASPSGLPQMVAAVLEVATMPPAVAAGVPKLMWRDFRRFAQRGGWRMGGAAMAAARGDGRCPDSRIRRTHAHPATARRRPEQVRTSSPPRSSRLLVPVRRPRGCGGWNAFRRARSRVRLVRGAGQPWQLQLPPGCTCADAIRRTQPLWQSTSADEPKSEQRTTSYQRLASRSPAKSTWAACP